MLRVYSCLVVVVGAITGAALEVGADACGGVVLGSDEAGVIADVQPTREARSKIAITRIDILLMAPPSLLESHLVACYSL